MALQEKKIMPPPWLAHREIERYSIGWRMGYGEDYIDRFGDWLDTLSPEERTEYRTLFPEPVTWKGWWDDEDSSEVLEHGDFWVNAWQPEGSPKYTRQWLQQEFSIGRKRELCLFWGHQPAEDGQLTKGKPMELFAKRMTWELDNEEGLSCLSFELEDGYFTLSRKTGAEALRLEMNDPANGQLIDPDCFEYALDNTRFRLNIVRNNRKVLRYLEEHHINTELYGEIVLHYTPLGKPQLESLSAVMLRLFFGELLF